MFALRFASFFLLSATTFVSAIPTPAGTGLAVRGAAAPDVQTVLNTLKSHTDTILPKIHDLVSSGTATDATVAPLINELNTELKKTSSALAALSATAVTKAQSAAVIAPLVAGVVTDLTKALDALAAVSAITTLETLLASVDKPLSRVLTELDTLVTGVLNLVVNLLVKVVGLLSSLGLNSTLSSLGGLSNLLGLL